MTLPVGDAMEQLGPNRVVLTEGVADERDHHAAGMRHQQGSRTGRGHVHAGRTAHGNPRHQLAKLVPQLEHLRQGALGQAYIDDAGRPVSSVYETTLPTIEGPLHDGSYYSFVVPWNPVDGEGRPVGPGRYKVTLERRPDTVSYTVSGGETVTEPLLNNTRTPSGFTFEID
ncbi:hypothetical protein FE784_30640 [Paenibacillus hemerocallicola]|uniref:Uncharacterized protein n=1 Tax=Paenibacillus hemerocallicola TaxID=1172614 RepID=A0A5C4T0F2_9BACL|nr:hypothetical protein [Paenibacillus hemerocallicola]TNJ62426.1 hypothetical protein FE784_30640 [Paenibacillus hemerocallicola]